MGTQRLMGQPFIRPLWFLVLCVVIFDAYNAQDGSCLAGSNCEEDRFSRDGWPSATDGKPYYFWPSTHGRPEHPRASPYIGPLNFSKTLAWKWEHPRGRYHAWLLGLSAIDD